MKTTFQNIGKEKQKRIIDAAIAEFAEHGFREASTNRLVKKIGISKGSLFKYFDSKLDLYLHLVDITVEQLLNHMSSFRPIKTDHPTANILAYAEREFDYLIAHPNRYRFFYQVQRDLNLPELAEVKTMLTRQAIGITEEILTDFGIPENRALREHVTLMLQAYNRMFMDRTTADVEWASLKGTFLSGLETHFGFVKWRL